MSNNDIRKRLPIKVSVTTIGKYRRKNGWLRPVTMQSQIAPSRSSTPNSYATDKTIENNEPPLELPPQIPLNTLVRNFWADKARAVDVLLLYYNPLRFPEPASVYPTGKRTPTKHCAGILKRLRYTSRSSFENH